MSEVPERQVDVFFYGLFMDKELLRAKGFVPTNERMASVDGFALRIGQRATLIPSPNNVVYGVVMSLSHDAIGALYSETSVRMYRPEAVIARFPDGGLGPALCFNLPIAPGPDEHNPEYAAKLRTLAKHLGFPSDYVASIQ